MSELEEIPYIDGFNYIEYLGEKLEDRKLITINRFLQEDRKNNKKEIERLNKIIEGLREERDYLFNKTTTESNYEIERLNNIIKEVREYIENNGHYDFYNLDVAVDGEHILEILDKVDKEK